MIVQTARMLMSSSSGTVTSAADSKILLSYLTRKNGAPTVSTSSLSSYYFSAISGGTSMGSSGSSGPSSSKNVLSTRPLDCQTTCHVLRILVSDRSLPKQFSLRLLQDVNAGRATKSQTQAVCVDLMEQISYVSEHVHHLLGDNASNATSSPSGTSLTVNATENESLHTVWMLYSELCGVMAAMVVSQTVSSSSSEEMGVGDSAIVSEICHWTEEICRALRKAESQSLFSAQVALAAALPSLPKADASAASKFRLTVRQVYSKQATPIDILRPSAKVHFVTVVCLPFMLSYVFAAYVVPLYRRTSISMMVSVLVAVCAVYMLIFQRRALLPPATQQVDVRKQVSTPSNSHMLQRLIADASTQEK